MYHLSFVLTVRETCSASWLASHSRLSPVMLAETGKVRVETVMRLRSPRTLTLVSASSSSRATPFLVQEMTGAGVPPLEIHWTRAVLASFTVSAGPEVRRGGSGSERTVRVA